MKFSNELVPYLKDTKFSNAMAVPIATPDESIRGRLECVVEMCEGKKIVHLGCADHKEIIDEKIRNNRWLHKLLTERSRKCIGVDNNIDALEHIRKLGFADVYFADITNEPALSVITGDRWDYLVMGEIIEHISNPATFLNSLRERYVDCIDKIIITTPNAFRFKNFTRSARHHKEIVNTDHRFWFTPYTLAKIAVDAGLWPEEFWLVENLKPSPNAFFKKWLLKKYPAYRDTIIMSCRLKP